MENGPEVINVTSSAGNTLIRPDSRPVSGIGGPGGLDLGTTSLRSASSLAALNNGGGGTLPRSSLIRNYAHGHGTLKKSADELRPLTADGHYHGHVHNVHKPSIDTLRRVHFEKSATPSAASSSNATAGGGGSPQPLTGGLPPATTATVVATTTVDQPNNVVTTAAPSNGGVDIKTEQHSHLNPNPPPDEDEGDTAM